MGPCTPRRAKRTSLLAAVIISAPLAMVRASIFAFLLGLAIHQGFVFTKGLDTSAESGDNRANFIVIRVRMGLCLAFFTSSFSAKDIENTLRTTFLIRDRRYHPPDAQPQFQTGNIEDTGTITKTGNNTETIQQDQVTHAHHSGDQDNSDRLAHIQCAEADRRVALEYARLSREV